MADWLTRGEVYFCVQHPDELYSPTVCRAFHQRLSLRLPELPPLPEWSDPVPPPAAPSGPDSSQGTLL